jgi:hemolysin activation/secretion protein
MRTVQTNPNKNSDRDKNKEKKRSLNKNKNNILHLRDISTAAENVNILKEGRSLVCVLFH